MTGSDPVPLFWKEAGEAGFDSVCALDFEGSDRTGVVEFGFVVWGPEGIREVGTGLCRPHAAISSRETETHGLQDEQLSGEAPFADHWKTFRDLRQTRPFLAHAAAVEDRFLRKQWPTVGEVPDWSEPPGKRIDWGPWLDSCALARSVTDGGSVALRPVVEGWGLAWELETLAKGCCPDKRRRWHAALYDSLASALIFHRVLEARPNWGVRRVFRESVRTAAEGEQGELF